jgi:hypothetical protein
LVRGALKYSGSYPTSLEGIKSLYEAKFEKEENGIDLPRNWICVGIYNWREFSVVFDT